jgi:Zn-dependent protease with chaperone function
LRLFLCNDPQLAAWRLYPQEEKTKIEMSFSLFPSSVFWFYSVFLALYSALIFQGIYFSRHSSDLIAFVRLIVPTVFCIFFHSCIADMRRYERFRNGAFSTIHEKYGLQETVIQEGLTFPEFNRYFILVLSFMLPMLVFLGSLALDIKSILSLLVIPLFLLLFALLVLAFASLRNPIAGQRIRLVLVGLQGGFIFSLISFIPVLHMVILPYRANQGVGFAVSLTVFLIAVLIIFISKNLYDTALGLRASLYHYKTDDKKSEFSMPPCNSAGHGLSNYSITALWLILSSSHAAGLILSLALLFHLTEIGFWAVLAQRKIQEIMQVVKLRSNSSIPEWIAGMLTDICDFARISKPIIVIDQSDSIAANAKFIFPIGFVLRLTKKAAEGLSPDELETLLAHEIFHIKRHSLPFAILNFLSEWTIFGSGFLNLAQNSKEMEYDADRFAVEWLGSKGKGKDILVGLLDKVSIVNSIGGLAYSKGAMNFIRTNHEPGGQSIHKFIDQLFFGDIILSYLHPTINERIERIMKS